ncbi:hypothetical protein MSTE_05017 [Mycobacteroides stephanolepidis]|uniref:Transmembrane protein n=1 Tax=[Mycobacterium] stephanolepidis TaxID=1520670 RepID=A0A1Z4F537_9MYCO|nr:hypothetical protein [[Mycobacterium] stephanolepidis]BAY00309.1 hypothetical protein MSTE_05017 [[Mycobacterium] stephanolepidis]
MTDEDGLRDNVVEQKHEVSEPSRRDVARAAGWGLLALSEGFIRQLFVEIVLFASCIVVVMCLISGQTWMKIGGVALGIGTLVAIVFALRKKLTVRQQWLLAVLLGVIDVAMMAVGWKLGVWSVHAE